jgi:hypothetical protein
MTSCVVSLFFPAIYHDRSECETRGFGRVLSRGKSVSDLDCPASGTKSSSVIQKDGVMTRQHGGFFSPQYVRVFCFTSHSCLKSPWYPARIVRLYDGTVGIQIKIGGVTAAINPRGQFAPQVVPVGHSLGDLGHRRIAMQVSLAERRNGNSVLARLRPAGFGSGRRGQTSFFVFIRRCSMATITRRRRLDSATARSARRSRLLHWLTQTCGRLPPRCFRPSRPAIAGYRTSSWA